MTLLAAHGLVICTYQRLERITFLLKYFSAMDAMPAFIVLVNGHKPGEKIQFPDASLLEKSGITVTEITCPPSTPLQRAEGVSALPPEVQFVHFIDDDFIPNANYFQKLASSLESDPTISGVGGVFTQPVREFSHPKWRKTFGLDGDELGKVLPSGFTTNGQANISGRFEPFVVDWLSGCSMSFRRSVLERVTFPSELEGYAMDEDLIISWQAGKLGKLLVIPEAAGVHQSDKDVRGDKQWFFYGLAARHHAVKFYLNPPASITKFWSVTLVRLAWRAWRNKLRPFRWPGYYINIYRLLTLNNAPKMDTFRPN